MSTTIKPPALAQWIHAAIVRNPRMTWPEMANETLQLVGCAPPADQRERVRAMVGDTLLGDALNATVDATIVEAFGDEADSTQNWCREMPAKNFRENELYVPATEARLERLARGGTAAEQIDDATYAKSTYKVSRFARKLTVDETDLVDGSPVGVFLQQAEQLGRQAARVRPDLVYSILLANAAAEYDSVALFHATHGNLGTAALSAAALDAAVASIGDQVDVDRNGRAIHVNRRAAYLVAPPALYASARRLVHNLTLDDGSNIVVRQESRLNAAGLLDPTNGETVNSGSATNWLLTTGSATPGVVVLVLEGDGLQPAVRPFTLDRGGRWGVGWDVRLDLGAVAPDHRSLYWSTGAA